MARIQKRARTKTRAKTSLLPVFNQITEMDEEDDCEFSSDIVRDYFKQAITTLGELNDALNQKDFATLSSKGHFLKGSSAALGVKKVQESCEHIQHYGHKRDEIKGVDLTEPQALRRIELLMPRLEKDYESAKAWLINYYSNRGVDLEEDDSLVCDPKIDGFIANPASNNRTQQVREAVPGKS
ncbi:Hpt domain-containing protein [Rhizoctonia solani AG-1 IA]|uniref:Hpt domain-containing protein n=1 Tax=Thanatephorus cucumeris (strain AG1-IA) TaxID=983506 RepID=L8WLZ9_THACA|nr:Hpt domain-containing protein [Rhizoctonia solani AG-1 IA]